MSAPFCRRHAVALYLALLVHPIVTQPTKRVLEQMKFCGRCVR